MVSNFRRNRLLRMDLSQCQGVNGSEVCKTNTKIVSLNNEIATFVTLFVKPPFSKVNTCF